MEITLSQTVSCRSRAPSVALPASPRRPYRSPSNQKISRGPRNYLQVSLVVSKSNPFPRPLLTPLCPPWTTVAARRPAGPECIPSVSNLSQSVRGRSLCGTDAVHETRSLSCDRDDAIDANEVRHRRDGVRFKFIFHAESAPAGSQSAVSGTPCLSISCNETRRHSRISEHSTSS